MDFTEPFKHSQSLTLYSPNAKYLASYHLVHEGFTRLHPSAAIQAQEDGGQGTLIIRFASTMQILRVIEIRLFRDSLPAVTEIGWAPDSTMILAACPATGTVHVYSVDQEDFKAVITVPGIMNGNPKLNGSTAGKNGKTLQERQAIMKKVPGYTPPGAECQRGIRFSADSRHILIWESQLLRVSIWSLERSPLSMSTIRPGESSLSASVSRTIMPDSGKMVMAIQYPKEMVRSSVTSFSVPPHSTLGTTTTTATGPGSQYQYSIRADLQYLAIVERDSRDCKDYVSIFGTEDYWNSPDAIHSFSIAEDDKSHRQFVGNASIGGSTGGGGIKDAEGILWSPDGRYLAVWENPNLAFRVAIYTMDGRRQGAYEVMESSSEDQTAGSHSSSTLGTGMGVKSVCWHPTSKLLALGGYDQKIRLLNHLTWKSILEFRHTAYINYGPKTTLWLESNSTVEVSGAARIQGAIEYTMVEQPAWVPANRIDAQKPNAKLGVGWCDFNCDGSLLASRNDNMPNVLWIWSMAELRPVAIIQQQSPIRVSRWDPTSPSRIVWCCGSKHVYSWRSTRDPNTVRAGTGAIEGGGIVEAIEVPVEEFEISSLRWCPDGKGLLLLAKDQFCLGFPIEEEEPSLRQQPSQPDSTSSIFSRLR
ncbi:WD repeat-containing protein wrap73 [Gryganskiella cystojenkinii]|nr:WD repeat-containing protein wrap73 [Gryganskiella cystojenkinii]